jgi:hypothetical protein
MQALLLDQADTRPTNLTVTTGLQLWLDGADVSTMYDATSGGSLVTNLGAIARWQDKSGNSRHATQAASGSRPTRLDNGLASRTVVAHNAQFTTVASSTATFKFLHDGTDSSIYVVAEMGASSNPNAAYVLLGNNGASEWTIGATIWYDDRASIPRNNALVAVVARGQSGSVASLAVGDAWTPDAFAALRIRIDADNGTAGNRLRYRFDNCTDAGGNTVVNAPSTANATYSLDIGAGGNSVSPMVGQIAEVLIYNRYLTAEEDSAVMDYLNRKWDLY